MKNENLYEELIEQMIIDEIFRLNPEKREMFMNFPTGKRRRMVLKELNKKDKSFFMDVILKNMLGVNTNPSEYIKELVLSIRKFIKVTDTERKQFGEVMTPISLVEDMLDTLPKDVWIKPELKWLDPCNGVGIFPIIIVERLMERLSSIIIDDNERYKHIIENMLYVTELQAKNNFCFLCAFDPKDIYLLNVYNGSFLDESFDNHMRDVWKIDKFDIIVGNPPYNTGTSGGNGARDLWDKFVIKNLDILKTDGFLTFVHPSKWRSPEHKIFKTFKENNLLFLEIHSKKDGKKVFGATTRYDFYCIQKTPYKGITVVIDELGESHTINLGDWDWIPNYNFKLISKILTKENGLDVIYSRSMYGNDKKWISTEQTEENKLPCVYGMYKDYTCSYRYSSINKGHFGISKVILGIGEKIYPKIDMDGEYGIMNNAFALPISSLEEGGVIKKAIESDKFKEIIKATKWSNFQTNYKMFKSFKKNFWKDFI